MAKTVYNCEDGTRRVWEYSRELDYELDSKDISSLVAVITVAYSNFFATYPGMLDVQSVFAEASYGEQYCLSFKGSRLANERECAEYDAEQARYAKMREDRERQEYEALKKKFGG